MEFNHDKSQTNVKVSGSNVPTPNPLMQTAQIVSQGQIPHNQQLQQTIQATQIALEEAKYESPLSAKGQILVEDTKNLLASASRLITEKNADEKLQRLVGSGISAGSATGNVVQGSNIPVGRSDLQPVRAHARSILDNGKSIGVFAVRSTEFRNLLLEVLELFQSILRTTQDKVAQQPGMNAGNVAKSMANEQVVGQEQKDALWDKFTVLLNQLAARPEYYTGVDHLFQVVDHMNIKAKQVKASTGGTEALPTGEYDRVWTDMKTVFESFAGMGTMDELERRNYVLYNEMREDPEARLWARNFRGYTMETIQNPQQLNDVSRRQHGQQLFNQGRYLLQGKYRNHFTDIFDQMKLILNNIKNDTVSQDFAMKLQKFGADFAFDSTGKPDLFVIQESLAQFRTILIPVLSKQLSNLPVPKVEGSNPKYDFAIEGLLLHVGDLLPEFINFRTKSDTRMAVQRLASQKSSVKIVMEVDRIRARFNDIRFFYRRKRTPKIEDRGIADVDISQGSGLSLRIVWKLKSTPNQPLLIRLVKVKCNIDRLAIRVRNSKHSILDKLATKLFAGAIKKQVANAIVNNIINTLQPLSAKLNELFKRQPVHGLMERANDQLKNTAFSGQPGVLAHAKDAITTGAQQVKQAVSSSKHGSTAIPSTPTTTTPVLLSEPAVIIIPENAYVETVPVAETGLERRVEGITFYEEPKRDYTFAWYSPSATDTVDAVLGERSTLPVV